MTAPKGQAIGINYGHVWQQRFSGPFRLLRDAVIPLDPLPGDLRLVDPTDPGNPVGRFRGRTELIEKIDIAIGRCMQQRRGGYLLIEAEAGMGKSALAAYLAFTRGWPAHFARLADGRDPETARRNLSAQLIACWRLEDAAPGGVLPADAGSTSWLHSRLCDAARARDRRADAAGEPAQPVVLLVDGLDEAPTPAAGELPLGLPPGLPHGTVVVATTRPKRINAPAGGWVVERLDAESATNLRDLSEYLNTVTITDKLIIDALHDARVTATRFCQILLERSGGVWIYALTVLDQIRDRDRSPIDIDRLPDGLASYYADNLQRWCADLGEDRWNSQGLPVLATLAASLEPQPAAVIAAWAGVPERAARTLLRGPFRPFLATHQGGDPDLYLPRHQSLREFIAGVSIVHSDDEDLRHLGHSLREATHTAHRRITTALTPLDPPDRRNWTAVSDYTRAHLAEHATHAGLLDAMVTDPGFLITCMNGGILKFRHQLRTAEGVAAVNAYEQAQDDWVAHPDDPPVWWLHVWAHKTRATFLARNAARHVQNIATAKWGIQAAMWAGTTHRVLTGHTDWVNAVLAITLPDGTTLLASASNDETVRLWDPITGQAAGIPLTGHTSRANALAAVPLPDGTTLLASAGDDGTIRLWEPTTGQPVGTPLIGHTGPVNALASVTLPSGDLALASAGDDGTIRFWEPTTGQPVGTPLIGHTDWVLALAAVPLPDGNTLLASAGNDGTVRLWNLTDRQPVTSASNRHTRPVNALVAVPLASGNTLLASAGDDGTIRLWEPTTGQPLGTPLIRHTDRVLALAAVPLPDGNTLLASAGNDGTIRLWEPTTGQPVGTPIAGHASRIACLAAIPATNGTILLAGGDDHEAVRLWDPTIGRTSGPALAGHAGPVNALAAVAQPDGAVLLSSASNDKTVRLWDPATGQPVGAPLTGHTDWVLALASVPLADGTVLLASGSADHTVRLWNPTTGQPVGAPLTGHTDWVLALASVPLADGTVLLASGSADHTVRLWNPTTGQPVGAPLTGHTNRVNAVAPVALSDSAVLLASGSADHTVRLWNPTTGQPVGAPLTGHTGPVNSIAVIPQPTGPTLLATGDDRAVCLWDPSARKPVGSPLNDQRDWVLTLAALPSPHGPALLASGSANHTVRLWNPTTGQSVGVPLIGHTGRVNSVAAVPLPTGPTLLATGGTDRAILVWTSPPHDDRVT
ncbi:hypothetical protein CcI49_18025 [Frankia sp. CcI49]|nr:hypothetical protein CcI49_18025 [Frankia sp. CcI49]